MRIDSIEVAKMAGDRECSYIESIDRIKINSLPQTQTKKGLLYARFSLRVQRCSAIQLRGYEYMVRLQ